MADIKTSPPVRKVNGSSGLLHAREIELDATENLTLSLAPRFSNRNEIHVFVSSPLTSLTPGLFYQGRTALPGLHCVGRGFRFGVAPFIRNDTPSFGGDSKTTGGTGARRITRFE